MSGRQKTSTLTGYDCLARVDRFSPFFSIPTHLFDMLDHYIRLVRIVFGANVVCKESVTVLQAFGPPTRKLFSYGAQRWRERGVIREKRKNLRDIFNEFVMKVDTFSRRTQVRIFSI